MGVIQVGDWEHVIGGDQIVAHNRRIFIEATGNERIDRLEATDLYY